MAVQSFRSDCYEVYHYASATLAFHYVILSLVSHSLHIRSHSATSRKVDLCCGAALCYNVGMVAIATQSITKWGSS